ncbi:uncharacterized protein LOC126902484 [Daktulosphaira vitifoliae]|uniref:uncharacterized protein LOC126902484 n=1 Tax=Daktulosphaira vitifoliae TaxID=58002 RepID=UPI0021AAE766|nr:uncharacterized protein LOC126902484 [Daktulosphaira vitifoliae]
MVKIINCIPVSKEVDRLYSEYGMNKDQVKADVANIRKWMLTQPHLPIFPEEKSEELNYQIEGYLRLTKNNIEKSKIALDSYFCLKTLYPKIFEISNLYDYVDSDIFECVSMLMLPKHTPDGLRVMYYGFNNCNSHLFQPVEIYRRIRIMIDVLLIKGIDFTGLHVIWDARYTYISQIRRLDLYQLKSLIKLSQMVITKNIETLWSHIPKDILPIELGGNEYTLNDIRGEWKDYILQNREWFISNANYKSDEAKRMRKEKKIEL